MNRSTPSQPNGSWYEIRVQGRLDRRWAAWLNGMTITPGDEGTTLVRGHVVDQPALHGLLARFRDLGVPLISVNQVPDDQELPNHPDTTTKEVQA
jgi:hypothetical protein